MLKYETELKLICIPQTYTCYPNKIKYEDCFELFNAEKPKFEVKKLQCSRDVHDNIQKYLR